MKHTRLYSALLTLLNVQLLDGDHDDAARLMSKYNMEMVVLEFKFSKSANSALMCAKHNITLAVIHCYHNADSDAIEFFKQALQHSIQAFNHALSIEEKVLSVRLQAIALLGTGKYFTAPTADVAVNGSSEQQPCNMPLIHDTCNAIFQQLVSFAEIQRAIRFVMRTNSKVIPGEEHRLFEMLKDIACLRNALSSVVGRQIYVRGIDGMIVNFANVVSSIALQGHRDSISALVVADGRLFTASIDKSIKVWDVESLTEIATLLGHVKSVYCLAAKSGKLFSGSDDRTIIVWDTTELVEIVRLVGHVDCVSSLVVNDEYLFSGSADQTIKVWKLANFEMVSTLGGHKDEVTSLALYSDVLFSGSCDGEIKVWNIGDQSEIAALPQAHDCCISSLVVWKQRLYSGSKGKHIRVWDISTMTEVMSLVGPIGHGICLAIDSGRLYAGSSDKAIRIFDLYTLEEITTITDHRGYVSTLAVFDGLLFSGSGDNTVLVRIT